MSRRQIGTGLLGLAALSFLLLVGLSIAHAPEWLFTPVIVLMVAGFVGGLVALLPYR